MDLSSDVVQSVADYLSDENLDVVLEVDNETAAEGAVLRLPDSEGSECPSFLSAIYQFSLKTLFAVLTLQYLYLLRTWL